MRLVETSNGPMHNSCVVFLATRPGIVGGDGKSQCAPVDASRLADAEKTEAESEISDALRARANYLTKIRHKVGSVLSLFCL